MHVSAYLKEGYNSVKYFLKIQKSDVRRDVSLAVDRL